MTLVQTENKQKHYISWKTFYHMVDQLADKVRASGYPFDVVVSIANNGPYIGKRIAQKLGIPHRIVHISRYHSEKPVIRNIDYKGGKCPLVVDDLTDAGTTLSLFFQYFEPAKSAVLFYNREGCIRPDFYIKFKPDAWVNFPWEEK